MTKSVIKKDISKIVIANRGEIACRIIHSAKKLGIKTVALYSSVDVDALHVEQADEAIFIGEAPAKESYLRSQQIINIAQQVGAQAIHPGYGFLSENADFAQRCEDNDIIFIGPPASAIEAMGLKSAAKKRMEAANVPLVPGYHGDDQSISTLKQACIDIGFPVLLKASAGGGGKGMRIVESIDEVEDAIAGAQREGLSSFSDSHLLVEKYLKNPRHIEIQLFCDQQGNGVYLFERDCSIQRRHQKIVEEAPAPNFPESIRKAMGETALQAAKAIGYVGAGTVEFLYEDNEFYFMEMNTRLQVEHPISEYISGQDLVAWQLKVAAGEPLPLSQSELKINGHAIEVRLYAEDPENDFLPSAGKIDKFIYPRSAAFRLDYENGIRMDTGVRSGDEVSPYYDPMIAKLIVWGQDRHDAINKLKQTLHHTHITGLTSNVRYLEQLISLASFAKAELNTHFIENNSQAIQQAAQLNEHNLRIHQIYGAWFLYQNRKQTKQAQRISSNDINSPWNNTAGWRLNGANEDPIVFTQLGKNKKDLVEISAQIQPLPSSNYLILIAGHSYKITPQTNGLMISGSDVKGQIFDTYIKAQVINTANTILVLSAAGSSEFTLATRLTIPHSNAENEQGMQAPMNGCLTEVRIQSGDSVQAGDTLIIMEAMKMEHNIKAPHDGIIDQVFFNLGDLVGEGAELLSFCEVD